MMKKENDDLTDLFRSQLKDATITPRDDFWNTIQDDLSLIEKKHRRMTFYRTVAAASVLLIIGAASAMFMLLKPQNETKSMIARSTNSATILPQATPNSHHQIEIKPQIPTRTLVAQNSTSSTSISNKGIGSATSRRSITAISRMAALSNNNEVKSDEDSTVTVSIHMTVRVRENGNYASNESNSNNVWQAGGLNHKSQTESNTTSQATDKQLLAGTSTKPWMLKATIGFSVPAKSGFEAPISGSITLEKPLNKWLAIESGLKYTYMHSDAQTLHYISIPAKANITLAKTSKIDLYATAGGSVDKCISATHQSANEKIQFTATAGLGLRYHFNNKLSIYTEPTFTHYFNNDAKYMSYRTEKNNAFNLQSGLCMNF